MSHRDHHRHHNQQASSSSASANNPPPSSQHYNPPTYSYLLGAERADFQALNKQLDLQAQINWGWQTYRQLMAHPNSAHGQHMPAVVRMSQFRQNEHYWFAYPHTSTPSPYTGFYPPEAGIFGSPIWLGACETRGVSGMEHQQQQFHAPLLLPPQHSPFALAQEHASRWPGQRATAYQGGKLIASPAPSSRYSDTADDDDESNSSSCSDSRSPLGPNRANLESPTSAARATRRRRDSVGRATINPSAPAFVPGGCDSVSGRWSPSDLVGSECYSSKLERWLNMDEDEFVHVIRPLTAEEYQAIMDAQNAHWKRSARHAGLTVDHPGSSRNRTEGHYDRPYY